MPGRRACFSLGASSRFNVSNLDDERWEVPVSKRNRHFNTEGKAGAKEGNRSLHCFTGNERWVPVQEIRAVAFYGTAKAVPFIQSVFPQPDPSIVVSWRTAEFTSNIGSP
jgi:hypothetical protein